MTISKNIRKEVAGSMGTLSQMLAEAVRTSGGIAAAFPQCNLLRKSNVASFIRSLIHVATTSWRSRPLHGRCMKFEPSAGGRELSPLDVTQSIGPQTQGHGVHPHCRLRRARWGLSHAKAMGVSGVSGTQLGWHCLHASLSLRSRQSDRRSQRPVVDPI